MARGKCLLGKRRAVDAGTSQAQDTQPQSETSRIKPSATEAQREEQYAITSGASYSWCTAGGLALARSNANLAILRVHLRSGHCEFGRGTNRYHGASLPILLYSPHGITRKFSNISLA